MAQEYSNKFLIADSLLTQGQYSKANLVFDEVVEEASLNNDWHTRLTALLKVSEIQRRIGVFEKSLETAHQVEDLVTQLDSQESRDLVLASAYDCIGIIHDLNSKFTVALDYYKKSLALRLRHLPEDALKIAVNYNNLGIVYDLMGKYDSSIMYHKKAIRIRNSNDDKLVLASSHYNLGIVYNFTGEEYYSISHLDTALTLRKEMLGDKHPYLAYSYQALANLYSKLGAYNRAIEFEMEAMRIHQPSKNELELARSYGNMGIFSMHNGDHAQARDFFRKSLLIRQRKLPQDHHLITTIYSSIAESFFLDGSDSCTFYLNKASQFIAKNGGTNSLDERINLLFSKIYLKEGSTLAAKKQLKKTIEGLDETFPKANIYEIESILQVAKIYALESNKDSAQLVVDAIIENGRNNPFAADYSLISIIEAIALDYELNEGGDDQAKERLLDQFYFADSIATNNYYKSILTNEDKLKYLEETTSLYFKATKCAFELYELTGKERFIVDAFFFSERSKSRILYEKTVRNKALDDRLKEYLKIEEIYNSQINQINRDLTVAGDSASIDNLNSKLFELRFEIDSVKESFVGAHPNLFKTLFLPKKESLMRAIDELDDQSAMIEFLINEEVQFCFVITKNSKDIFSLPDFEDLQGITDIIYDATINHEKSGAFPNWISSSNELFNACVTPFFQKLKDENISKVEIVDGVINKIPIGMSIADLPDTSLYYSHSNLDYLIKHFEIDYRSSFSLQERNTKHDLDIGMTLSVAPKYSDSLLLLFNQKEVAWLSSFLDSDYLSGHLATESWVKDKIDRYQILHFATHSIIDINNFSKSGLLLKRDSVNDGVLYENELMEYTSKAKLVFLNTCESGLGQYKTGEGNMSLARSFKYIGSNAVIFNQWKVDDRFAFEFTKEFYKNLVNEEDIRKAFRATQLGFINHENPKFSNPYYWGSFVLLGENSKLKTGQNNPYTLVFLALLTIAVLFYFRKKSIS